MLNKLNVQTRIIPRNADTPFRFRAKHEQDASITRLPILLSCIGKRTENFHRVASMRTRVSAFLYQPKIYANISGATIEASDSTMNFGVEASSLPQVIFSLGTAPE